MVRDGHRLARFAQGLTIARAVVAIATVTVAVTVAAAALARVVEPHTFGSFGEACWWALQTVSTVGYGDTVPMTGGGRVIGAVLMLLGVAFVPAVTAIVVAVLVSRLRERSGRHADYEEMVVARLQEIERRLGAGREEGDG